MSDDTTEPKDDADSKPEIAAESDPGLPVDPPRPLPMWRRASQWLLPPVLAVGAMGMHWWINVPENIAHSPRDQGAAKADKKSKRRAARERFAARDQRRIDREWKRWNREDFEGEPVRGPWARKFQAVVSKAVVVARRDAFAKAPEEPRAIVTGTECRTVRCRFILRSPFEHELPVLDDALRRIVDHNGTIWRTYESKPITAPSDAPKDHHHYQVEVSFVSDEVDSRGFEVGPTIAEGGGPRRQDRPEPGDAEASGGVQAEPEPEPELEPESERGGAEDTQD